MKDFPKFSGANLLAARSNVKGVSMTRQTLATLSGIAAQSIYVYEMKGSCPTFDGAIALATAMGIPIKNLTTDA